MIRGKIIEYKKESRIALYFEYDKDLVQEVRALRGRKWSQTLRVWHLPDTENYRRKFNLPLFEGQGIDAAKAEKIEKFIYWLKSKRYSENTIHTYTGVVQVFLRFFEDKEVSVINNDDVIRFNNEYILKRKLSSSYQNQFVNGIKLFFSIVEDRKIEVSLIHRPRVERKLPRVLSKKEVKAIIEAHANIKHRAMLSLIYACGLRRSELLNLQLKDVLSDRHLLHVYQSKGNKDRVVPISNKIIDMLRNYYKAYRPKVWMFEGEKVGEQYSPKSLHNVLKNALIKAKIRKPVTLHWLRHSYATHLLENGTDIRYIQELLGHNSSRTTEIYTHVSKRDIQQIKSPFDDL